MAGIFMVSIPGHDLIVDFETGEVLNLQPIGSEPGDYKVITKFDMKNVQLPTDKIWFTTLNYWYLDWEGVEEYREAEVFANSYDVTYTFTATDESGVYNSLVMGQDSYIVAPDYTPILNYRSNYQYNMYTGSEGMTRFNSSIVDQFADSQRRYDEAISNINSIVNESLHRDIQEG